MYIEQVVTFTFEDHFVPQQTALLSFVPKDERAHDFLHLCKEGARTKSFHERERPHHPCTLFVGTMKSGTSSGNDHDWNDLLKEGWRFASLAHWYHYLQRVKLTNETFALCGDLYRDETFEEWVPFARKRDDIFGRTRSEVIMKRRIEYLTPKDNAQWLVAKIVEKKE